jgi:hypothetical protein
MQAMDTPPRDATTRERPHGDAWKGGTALVHTERYRSHIMGCCPPAALPGGLLREPMPGIDALRWAEWTNGTFRAPSEERPAAPTADPVECIRSEERTART